jgi:hypothetical protein
MGKVAASIMGALLLCGCVAEPAGSPYLSASGYYGPGYYGPGYYNPGYYNRGYGLPFYGSTGVFLGGRLHHRRFDRLHGHRLDGFHGGGRHFGTHRGLGGSHRGH